MTSRRLIGTFLTLAVAACNGDGDGETAVPTIDTAQAAQPGEVRAGLITSDAALVGGPAAESAVGDFKIYNERVAFVIHNEKPSDGYVQNGGAIVDADLVRPEGEPGQDMIKEHSPIFGLLRLHEVKKVKVVDAGGPGRAAIVEATGSDGTVEFAAALGATAGGLASLFTALDLSRSQKLEVTTRYILEPSKNALKIETVVKNGGSEHWPRPIEITSLLQMLQTFFGGPERLALRRAVATLAGTETLKRTVGDALIFTDHAADPYMLGVGFDRKEITNIPGIVSLLTAGAETPSNTTAMLGAVGERNEVAYGYFQGGGEPINVLVGPGTTGDFMIYAAYTAAIELEPGEEKTFVRYLAVGKDVAEVNASRLEGAGAEMGTLSGTVRAGEGGPAVAGARVHALDSEGKYGSMAVSDSDGAYSMNLSAGDWRVVATGDGEGEDIMYPPGYSFVSRLALGYGASEEAAVNVPAGGGATQDLAVKPAAALKGTVKDSQGTALPSKISFRYAKSPKVDEEEAKRRAKLWVKTPYPNTEKVVWTTDGSFQTQIEVGEYVVTASQGFEYETDSQTLTFEGGQSYDLTFTLKRAIELKDMSGKWVYVSIDSHRHAAPSNHGETRVEDSVITNLAEGLFAFASSDHDIVTDYGSILDALGLKERIVAFPSVEISTAGFGEVNGEPKEFNGHFNPFPVVPLGGVVNAGAPPWWKPEWDPARIFKYAREKLQAKLVQINHGGDDGYFCWRQYDPAANTAADPKYSADYDLMEIINGKGKDNWNSELTIWYGHLNFGRAVGGVGVSDSHQRLDDEPGYGRTYIGVEPSVANVPAFNGDALAAAIKRGNIVISGGPFIRAEATDSFGNRKGIGETVKARFAGLSFQILAPSWMGPLDFRVNENGKVLYSTADASKLGCAVGAGSNVVRYDCSGSLVNPKVDSWYNIEARARAGTEAANTLDPVYPGAIPFAVTGPIYLDLEGDGWTPPNIAPDIRRADGKTCD
ncbi:MAG: carboxypeptidase regulatory-like domain-containing protein [Nitrospirae bacterium]|nr:carboxypeptidase regulatory-like domain-containing protein [Nitrospirota bacterium]